jgi:small multidrug resistance family-3 protein
MTLRSILLFILAGLFEIGGGYLVWQWWRNNAGVVVGALGGLILFLYGILPTYQTEQAARMTLGRQGRWLVHGNSFLT